MSDSHPPSGVSQFPPRATPQGQFPPGGAPGPQGFAPDQQGVPPGGYQQGQFPPGQFAPGAGGFPPGQPGSPPKAKRGGKVLLFLILGVLGVVAIVAALQAAGIIDGTTAVTSLDVGDCVMIPDDMEEVTQLTSTNCDNPHDGEVFFLGTAPGDAEATYPVLSLNDTAIDQCLGAFTGYTGQDFATSDLDIVFLTPTFGSWDAGDRGITCIITTLDGSQLTGSQAG